MDDKIIQDIDTSENRLPEYLSQLNPQQRDAVVYTGGPSLVIAGAGSGKTRVLTYKIVHLLSHGFEPFRLMVLTFTNKAARERENFGSGGRTYRITTAYRHISFCVS